MKYEHDIKLLCKVLKVNRSTYYKHFYSKPSKRTLTNIDIKTKILEIYSESDMRLGANKIRIILESEYGIRISLGRIYRLMKSMCLPKMSTIKPKYKNLLISNENCQNNLNGQFNPDNPNMVWVSDITYIKVVSKFYYLCVIIDLFSRKVIAYKISSRMTDDLTIETLELAYGKRNYPKSVLFHSDRGSQYISKNFRKKIEQFGFIQSFSKKGYPYDNACAESFFKYFKKEESNRRNYQSLTELQLATFKYIDNFYNNKRPHSHNNGLSPNKKEFDYNLT